MNTLPKAICRLSARPIKLLTAFSTEPEQKFFNLYGNTKGPELFLKKLKTELPYDPAIPPMGVYLEKTIVGKDTCTSAFTAAL